MRKLLHKLSKAGFSLLVILAALAFASPAKASGPGFYYAGAAQVLTGTDNAAGLGGKIYVAKPYIQGSCATGADHSLMELTVNGGSNNTVEVGWVVYPAVFGDCDPHLFASIWSSGTWCGSYTGAGCNWQDNGSVATNLGANLATTAALCNGSSLACVKQFNVFWSNTACGAAADGWWIQYDGLSIGCFTPSAFSGTFHNAQTFQAFGEYYYSGATVPCGDMGNGNDPATALGNAGPSYFGSVSLASPSPSTLTTSFTANTSTAPAAYDVHMVSTRTFAVSGAGYTAGGSTPGSDGSC